MKRATWSMPRASRASSQVGIRRARRSRIAEAFILPVLLLLAGAGNGLSHGTVVFVNSIFSRVQLSTGGTTAPVPTGHPVVYGVFWGRSPDSLMLNDGPLGVPSATGAGIIAAPNPYEIVGGQENEFVFLKVAGWNSSFGRDALAARNSGATYGETALLQVRLGPSGGPGAAIWRSSAGGPGLPSLILTGAIGPTAHVTFGLRPFSLSVQERFPGAGEAVIPLLRSSTLSPARLDFSSTVRIFTTNLGATAGVDYVGTNFSVTFAAGETNREVRIPILPDEQWEGEEQFSVALAAISPDVSVTPDPFLVRIQDPPAPTLESRIVLPAGSVWKYLDTGALTGTSWREPGFDDSNWKSGRAPLGYDLETQPATVISYGPEADHKHLTAWFRTTFVVTNAAAYHRLLLRYRRDDGIAVYLNGMEVLRDNLPSGELTPLSLATEGIEETDLYHTGDVLAREAIGPLVPLFDGTNVIAAEVHQWAPESTDLLFDLEVSDLLSRGPYLQAGTSTGAVVRWRTAVPTESRVSIGREPGAWDRTFTLSGLRTDHELTVSVTNLSANGPWYFGVGTSNRIFAWGSDCHFRTGPANPASVRIWALGDSGTASLGLPDPEKVRKAYQDFSNGRPTDVLLLLGDNAYYEGRDEEFQLALFDVFARELRHTMVWPTIGNHETFASTDHGLTFPYLDIFSPPVRGESGGAASGTKRYYSFDHANIHFVSLDAMSGDRSSNGVMCTWLRADLEANTNQWLIAFWHHPPYSKGTHDSDAEGELIEMRQNVVPILEEYGVDLVLCGHSHNYERSRFIHGHYGNSSTFSPLLFRDSGSGRPEDTGPYRKYTDTPESLQGAVYVVAGSSGFTGGGLLNHPIMFRSLDRLGSMVVDVSGSRLDGTFLSEAAEVLDHFTILKGGDSEPLRFIRLEVNNGLVKARWKATPGRRYRIERSAALGAGSIWTPVSGEIVATDATSTWTESVPGGTSSQYYRIIKLP